VSIIFYSREEQELQGFLIADLEFIGLTKREAQVQFWIARIKIMPLLKCSVAVKKQCENI